MSPSPNRMQNFRRRIPPLTTLVTFEAAARLLNFTRAAKELSVTQAAISRQVKELEDHLQVQLFERGYRHVALTDAGLLLAAELPEMLSDLAQLCDTIRRPHEQHSLVVGMTSAFGTYWLTSRLQMFRQRFPTIDLRLAVNDDIVDLASEQIDLSIRYGSGQWPRLRSEFLIGAEDMPVCSPGYWSGRRKPKNPADLLGEVLIYMEGAPVFLGSRWSDWFAAAGVEAVVNTFSLTVNNFGMMIQATLQGQGIALAGHPLIDDLLAQGLLVPAIASPRLRVSGGYYLVEPDNRPRRQTCDHFRTWLMSTLRGYIKARGLERLLHPNE